MSETTNPNPIPSPTTARPSEAAHLGLYGHNGRITRAGAEGVLRAGGSVLIPRQIGVDDAGKPIFNNVHITRLVDLPSEADFATASGDKSEVDRVRADLEQQVKAKQSEIDALRKQSQQPTPAKADATPPRK